jgi:hypothetical protein
VHAPPELDVLVPVAFDDVLVPVELVPVELVPTVELVDPGPVDADEVAAPPVPLAPPVPAPPLPPVPDEDVPVATIWWRSKMHAGASPAAPSTASAAKRKEGERGAAMMDDP